MDIEKILDKIEIVLKDAYRIDPDFTSFILVASAYHDTRVCYSAAGTAPSLLALVNKIISAMAKEWNLSTNEVIQLIREGQGEYDEFIKGVKK